MPVQHLHIRVLFFFVCVCFVLFAMTRFNYIYESFVALNERHAFKSDQTQVIPKQKVEDMKQLIDHLIEKRNNFSRELNLKQQKIGQLVCEKNTKLLVADTGGWCASASKEDGGKHRTDVKFVPALAEFFEGKMVGSFGDGPGKYKQLLLDTGKLKGYDAYDGAPFSEKTSEGRVAFLDLTLPQYGIPLYDWIISLEVAEHIPAKYESIFMDNIIRHANEGVVLSWAVPGQHGLSHVNNQPFAYVKKLFSMKGFDHDESASKKLQEAASFGWLKRNTNVYRRRNSTDIQMLKNMT